MVVKTVGELKKALKEFPDDMKLRLLLSWYDRNNYNYATSDRSQSSIGEGIAVDIYKEDECCTLANEDTYDIGVFY